MCWPDGPPFPPDPDRGQGQIPPAPLDPRMTVSRPARLWGLVAAQAASRGRLAAALMSAGPAALVLREAPGPAAEGAGTGPAGRPADLALHRAEIDQATGMLTEQLGVGITEAFVRLRAYAYAHDRRLADLARDIVARRVRLRPDPGLSPHSPV